MVSVVLAGGGTAGHTSPLIATADRIAELVPDVTRTVIGTPKGLESRVIPAAGLTLELIPPVPMPRKPSPQLFAVPGKLWGAVSAASEILRRARADVLVGFGGYVSMPAYVAARRLKLPIVVHEQNAVPGLANKVAAKLTTEIFTSFESTPLPHATYIGLPVRKAIQQLDRAALRSEAAASFGLDPTRPTLLVSGGSQGARSINKAVLEAYPKLLAAGVQVLHVLGPKNFTEEMTTVTDETTGAIYQPVAYVDRMELAYAVADLMLCRSGAGTVVETAVVGLPCIFVPLPHGNGEQAKNCESLVTAGAAELVADQALTGLWLADRVITLLGDKPALAAMSEAARGHVPADADDRLARRVLALAGWRGE
ncbi:undecaprenyldiphospho-muramoylpentapeptide beta-N-acetylglucosaminyltransferase [Granulicoccus phenolivorans]|uniref:undecaprenyldiphospho-muramoylpentapeptide beta-N-acetylglucosaminyltransferase n=1 Tax=Granulicoccus phenolivorans TaxID=266854 RepID=UPI0003F4E248|nr:undecaprenyldiphospho-muramoylpentapeptide beta-N-acetylglucosaminyltransferase [Granulicoccus phenolivorans]